jgi:hypothetical protein
MVFSRSWSESLYISTVRGTVGPYTIFSATGAARPGGVTEPPAGRSSTLRSCQINNTHAITPAEIVGRRRDTEFSPLKIYELERAFGNFLFLLKKTLLLNCWKRLFSFLLKKLE